MAARLGPTAGAAPGGEILHLSEEDWDKALQLKFMGYVRCIKAVLPHMLRRRAGRMAPGQLRKVDPGDVDVVKIAVVEPIELAAPGREAMM